MKKYIFLIFVLFLPKVSFGDFLSDPTGLDLYKKIDSGIFELEVKYLDKELKGGDEGGDIVENINKIAKTYGIENSCLKGSLKTQDIKNIYFDNNPNEVLSKVLKDCFDEKDESISTTTLDQYLKIINKVYENSEKQTQTKVNNIYKIGNIGMYSDGIEENSPFDLMVDLQNINSIIFEEKITYDGVNANQKEMKNYHNNNSTTSGVNENTSTDDGNQGENINNNQNDATIIYINSGACLVNNSGFNDNILNDLLKSTQDNSESSGSNSENSGSNSENSGNNPIPQTNNINNNSNWPCNDFFCINIEEIVYNNNLLIGGTNLSIEGLLKRSNNHLKRFVSTSLVQSKMTTNNFEFGLKDLNLPDIFHVGIQVSYKPVPLLDIGEDNKTDDEFKHKNLLAKYYKNLGLDFERANDLNIFTKKEQEIKSLLDSQELGENDLVNKTDSFNFYLNQMKKENDFISQTVIDKKIIAEDMDNFYKQFLELESFSRAIMDYSLGLKGVIGKMNEIPQTGGN